MPMGDKRDDNQNCSVLFFHVSFGHFVLVLLAFVVFNFSVLSQEVGWE